MRAVFSILIVLAVVALVGALVYTSTPSKVKIVDFQGQERVDIVLKEDGFEPRDIRVTRGTVVTFTTTRPNKFWPASNAHPSHDVYPQFDPQKVLSPEESWSFTFDVVGVWGYHDHVRSYFTGVIYVDE